MRDTLVSSFVNVNYFWHLWYKVRSNQLFKLEAAFKQYVLTKKMFWNAAKRIEGLKVCLFTLWHAAMPWIVTSIGEIYSQALPMTKNSLVAWSSWRGTSCSLNLSHSVAPHDRIELLCAYVQKDKK